MRTIKWALQPRGFELPRWGPDGHLGSKTWLTLADFARDRGIAWSAKAIEDETRAVPQAVTDALLSLESLVTDAVATPTSSAGVIDMRPARAGDPPKTKRDASGKVVVRDPAKISRPSVVVLKRLP